MKMYIRNSISSMKYSYSSCLKIGLNSKYMHHKREKYHTHNQSLNNKNKNFSNIPLECKYQFNLKNTENICNNINHNFDLHFKIKRTLHTNTTKFSITNPFNTLKNSRLISKPLYFERIKKSNQLLRRCYSGNTKNGIVLEWYPAIDHIPKLEDIKTLESSVDQFLERNQIEEQLHGHFESLALFESPRAIIQLLTENSSSGSSNSNLEAYIHALKLLYKTSQQDQENQLQKEDLEQNNTQNFNEGYALLKELELESYPPALETLAILSYDSNYDAAISYHKRASDMGFLESNLNYGCHLIDTSNQNSDIKLGMELIVEAANKGYVPAMLFLSRLFCMGRGRMPSNASLCYAWGEVAMNHGSIEGGGFVGIGLISDKKSPELVDQGIKLLKHAADVGYVDMQGHYGFISIALLNNIEEGVHYLKDHVHRDDCLIHTLFVMGDLYLKGIGVEQDVDCAISLWEKGAKHLDPGCIAVLAELYANGFASGSVSVMPDYEKAVHYYELSVKHHKNKEAQQRLDMFKKYKKFF